MKPTVNNLIYVKRNTIVSISTFVVFTFIMFLSAPVAKAQPKNNAEKSTVFANVDSLLMKFMAASPLGELESGKLSNAVVADFKKLFMPDAKIFDEINPDFQEDVEGNPYWNSMRKVGDYCQGILINFSEKLTFTNNNLAINFDSLNQSVINVALARQVDGITKKRSIFQNNDTLLIRIVVLNDLTVKISGIRALGYSMVCLNDEDNDGVIDENDKCKGEKGKLLLDGCPDQDSDGIADKYDDCKTDPGPPENNGCPSTFFANTYMFSAFAGFQLNNNNLKMPELDKIGYNSMDLTNVDKNANTLSQRGKLKNPGALPGWVIGANIAYYFGKTKNRTKGVSLGVTYARYSGVYIFESAAVYTFKAFDGVDEYRRQITLKEGSKETIKFNMINVPLLYRQRKMFGTKWSGEVGLGPSLIIFKNTSESEMQINYIGIYQMENNQDYYVFKYNDYYNENTQLLLRLDGTLDDHLPSNNGADTTMDNLTSKHGYDLGLNKYRGATSSKKLSRIGGAVNINIDASYKIRTVLALKLGFSFVYAPFQDKSEGYIPTKSNEALTTDSYQSIYTAKTKFTYTSYGLHLGIILML